MDSGFKETQPITLEQYNSKVRVSTYEDYIKGRVDKEAEAWHANDRNELPTYAVVLKKKRSIGLWNLIINNVHCFLHP